MESGKKQELWEKLRRVGERGGQTTPVASFWRRYETGDSVHHHGGGGSGEEHDGGDLNENGPTLQLISSRKLAAALWELHRYNGDVAVTVPPPCLRPLKITHHRRSPPVSPHDMLPESSSNSRSLVAESLAQNHRSIKKKPLTASTAPPSTSSYGSSMEILPYKPSVSPSISIELKGGACTQLVKVLNRIWRLEEQHVADTSLIKALKKELKRARFQTKELVREHQADRNHLDQLMKHITEDKAVRKDKEHHKIDAKTRNQRPCSCKGPSIIPCRDE